MAYAVLTFEQIRANLLRDLANLRPELDVGPDSDYFVRATSVASAVEGLYQHQQWIARQIFPDTADAEYLELHAALRGLKLKPAVPAGGTVLGTGIADTVILTGLTFTLTDGRQYVSTAQATVPLDGQVSIPMQALIAGEAGNAATGTSGTFLQTPAGLDSTGIIDEMVGGTEREKYSELLERLLELIRRPPAGGNKYDYRRWAMEVPGVSNAYVYPLRRGLGTVDVALVSAGGLPSGQTIQAAQDHIDDVRPVTAKNTLVFAPDILLVDIVVRVRRSGISLAVAASAIQNALAAQFDQVAPGQSWIRSKSEAVISAVRGIEDRHIESPVDNVVPVVDGETVQWLRLGVVTVLDMQ